MGWTHKHRKLRDHLRKAYTEQTGSTDYTPPAFQRWLEDTGALK